MSSATHSNVFRQELDEAVREAHAAVDVVVEKFNKFVAVKTAELEAQVPATPVVSAPAPVAPEAPVAPAAPVAPEAPAAEAPETPSEPTDAEDAAEQAPAPGKSASTSQPSK